MKKDEKDLLARYNYPEFSPRYFEPWMRFDVSPSAGEIGADFPLWCAETGTETTLAEQWSQQRYTVIEFGSFT